MYLFILCVRAQVICLAERSLPTESSHWPHKPFIGGVNGKKIDFCVSSQIRVH